MGFIPSASLTERRPLIPDDHALLTTSHEQNHLDPHVVQPWVRLYKDGKMVGYSRQIGKGAFFSSDGYGWSGYPIAAERRVQQIPVRLHSKRVFHGDIVQVETASEIPRILELVVLLGPEGDLFFGDVQSMKILPAEEIWPEGKAHRIRNVVDSIINHEELLKRLEQSALEASGHDHRHAQKRTILTASIVVCGMVAASLQMAILGQIGPLMTALGCLSGGSLFWIGLKRWNAYALRRQSMLKLSFQCGIAIMGVMMVSALVFNWIELRHGMWLAFTVKTAAFACLGFAAGCFSSMLGAELVAWQSGGYVDDATSKS